MSFLIFFKLPYETMMMKWQFYYSKTYKTGSNSDEREWDGKRERNPELYWQILEKMKNIFETKCSGKLCLVIGISVTTTIVSY